MIEHQNQSKVEFGGNYLINIVNDDLSSGKTKRLGDYDSILEIEYNQENNKIISVSCPLCSWICKYGLDLPEYKNLKKIDEATITLTPQNYLMILYDKKNVNIFLESIPNIKQYYTNGRVDYYYDENMELCNIRIRDITEEEYNIMRDEELQIGHYMTINKENKTIKNR